MSEDAARQDDAILRRSVQATRRAAPTYMVGVIGLFAVVMAVDVYQNGRLTGDYLELFIGAVVAVLLTMLCATALLMSAMEVSD